MELIHPDGVYGFDFDAFIEEIDGERPDIAVTPRRYVEISAGAGDLRLSPEEARRLARLLLRAADSVEGVPAPHGRRD